MLYKIIYINKTIDFFVDIFFLFHSLFNIESKLIFILFVNLLDDIYNWLKIAFLYFKLFYLLFNY